MRQVQHSRLESEWNLDLRALLDGADKVFSVVDEKGNRLFSFDALPEFDTKRIFVLGVHHLTHGDRLNCHLARVGFQTSRGSAVRSETSISSSTLLLSKVYTANARMSSTSLVPFASIDMTKRDSALACVMAPPVLYLTVNSNSDRRRPYMINLPDGSLKVNKQFSDEWLVYTVKLSNAG